MLSTEAKKSLIKQSIITIPDYPHAGILFRDITGILGNAAAFQACIDLFVERYQSQQIDKVIGTEARGFIFAAPLALALKTGFVPVRKPNKLPREVYTQSYQLEYGEDQLQIHTDAIQPGEKVLIVDDLLATGGTVAATAELVKQCGGEVVEAAFVINLVDLAGAQKLAQAGVNSYSLVEFIGL